MQVSTILLKYNIYGKIYILSYTLYVILIYAYRNICVCVFVCMCNFVLYFIKIDFYNIGCEMFTIPVCFYYLGGETDGFELQTQKQNFYRGKSLLCVKNNLIIYSRCSSPKLYGTFFLDFKGTGRRSMGKGKLTERLIAEGLLTPQMLRELQSEWIQSTKKKK